MLEVRMTETNATATDHRPAPATLFDPSPYTLARREGPRHRQVRVEWRGRVDLVDEGIAPLIRELWRAGVDTWMSCERQDWTEFHLASLDPPVEPLTWINFTDMSGVEVFLGITRRVRTAAWRVDGRHVRFPCDQLRDVLDVLVAHNATATTRSRR
jgi:hypothetical protein